MPVSVLLGLPVLLECERRGIAVHNAGTFATGLLAGYTALDCEKNYEIRQIAETGVPRSLSMMMRLVESVWGGVLAQGR
eukprot:536367-Rhodomonas_salina.1